MKVTKKTIYQVEDFDLRFKPADDDNIIIEKTDKGYDVKYLTYDCYADNPFDNQDGMGNFYHWKDKGRDELEKYCEYLGYDIGTRVKIGKENPLAVKIDKYEHGGISYSIAGQGMQCQFDTSSAWAVWFPDKCALDEIMTYKTKETQRKRALEIAKEACELFNNWANGECFCIVKETFDLNKESIEYDIVGGYYGRESAEEALKTDI